MPVSEKGITLREGLLQFYRENAGKLSHLAPNTTAEAKAFFKAHDVAHVLFDCDTSLVGEGKVKIWTIFGTTLGFWNHIKAYQKVNATGLAKAFSYSQVLTELPKLLTSIPGLIRKASKMHKAWPWSDFEDYLDKPISKIRQEFNILI